MVHNPHPDGGPNHARNDGDAQRTGHLGGKVSARNVVNQNVNRRNRKVQLQGNLVFQGIIHHGVKVGNHRRPPDGKHAVHKTT